MAKKKITKKPKGYSSLEKWARTNEVVVAIHERLNRSRKYRAPSKKIIAELHLYVKKPILIPKKLDSSNRKNVRRMQRANSELDARASRVASIQFSIAKVLQTLERSEVLIKAELYRAKLLDITATQPKQKSTVAVICPALAESWVAWKGMENLCSIVSSRVHDSFKSLQRQVKLDENARWADKIAP